MFTAFEMTVTLIPDLYFIFCVKYFTTSFNYLSLLAYAAKLNMIGVELFYKTDINFVSVRYFLFLVLNCKL